MEIYKDIKGYEGYYQVSNYGNVKSILRDKLMHNGGVRKYGDKVLSQRVSGAGYYQAMLCKDNVKKYYLTHRLVLGAFCDNKNNLPQVNHINGIKTDNRLENLEWISRRENQLHAIKLGLQPKATGEQRGRVCKLKWVQVQEIKALINIGVKSKLIAERYNVNAVTISDIKRGATWKEK